MKDEGREMREDESQQGPARPRQLDSSSLIPHLSSFISSAAARQIDQVCDRFEAAWKSGARPDAVDALGGILEPLRTVLLRQLLLLDWEYRSRSGEDPRPADYLARFPTDRELIDAVSREMSQAAVGTRLSTGVADTPWVADRDAPGQGATLAESTEREPERYEMLDEVGRGGIGVVYRGRDRILGRAVAVKVLAEPLRDRPEARRRFFTEARVGSLLQHPAIVPVYEVGRSSDGRPLFTMKLVEGRTLAALLRERPSPGHDLPRLLSVFEQVCQAIAYAHDQGIVHRDLKPANIMVGEFGEVQVMDWGFAKMAGDTQQAASSNDDSSDLPPAACCPLPADHTQSGALMGTPAYMPPEQARGEAGRVGPRSDVFALGGILCEILTGQPPYAADSPDEVCRKAAAADLADAHDRLDRCGADAALLDLAKRCLSTDRAARPANGGAAANELTDYLTSAQDRVRLAQLAQSAAEARATAERQGRRIALGLAVALLVGLGVAAWQAVVATGAKRDALAAVAAEKQAKETADAKEAETRAVLNFVETKVIAAARPKGLNGGLGPGVTVRTALEAALPFVAQSFIDRPLIEARLRMTLAESYFELRDLKAASDQYSAARAIYARLLGPDDRDTLNAANGLADCYDALGRGLDAARLLEEIVATRTARFGRDDIDTLRGMNDLGRAYFTLERYDDAIRLHEETLALKRAKLGPEDRGTLATMVNLANCYGRLDRHLDALKLRKEALAIQKARFGPKDFGTLMSLNNLASSYRKLGKYADALNADEEALAARIETLGPKHPDTLSSMWGKAEDLLNLGRGSEAVPILDDCLRRAIGQHVHQRFSNVADLRLRHFEISKDAAGCRTTAELWEMQGRTDARSLYEAAVCRAVTAAVIRETDRSPEGSLQADAEADRSVAWLRRAAAADPKIFAKIRDDKDFGILRNRADYRQIIGEPAADKP
jgi:serine/threonine-protein kinase